MHKNDTNHNSASVDVRNNNDNTAPDGAAKTLITISDLRSFIPRDRAGEMTKVTQPRKEHNRSLASRVIKVHLKLV